LRSIVRTFVFPTMTGAADSLLEIVVPDLYGSDETLDLR
jgi:hypothetical protein